jgi:hypothetical protein
MENKALYLELETFWIWMELETVYVYLKKGVLILLLEFSHFKGFPVGLLLSRCRTSYYGSPMYSYTIGSTAPLSN